MMGNDEHNFYGAYLLRDPALVITDPDLANQIFSLHRRDDDEEDQVDRLICPGVEWGQILDKISSVEISLQDVLEDSEGEFEACEMGAKFSLEAIGTCVLGLEDEVSIVLVVFTSVE